MIGSRGAALAALLTLTACATQPKVSASPHGEPRPLPHRGAARPAIPASPPPAQDYPAASLTNAGRVADLPGWAEEDHRAALQAFAAGCGVSRDPLLRAPCLQARAMASPSAEEARTFFERGFRTEPLAGEGVLTAYFAPEYTARRSPTGGYTAPVRPRPGVTVVVATLPAPSPSPAASPPEQPDVISRVLAGLDPDRALAPPPPVVTPAPVFAPVSPSAGVAPLATADRTAIETAPAPDALAWMRPEDLFFLQIQGSGTLVFPDGDHSKIAYAGDNGRPFVAIARPMVERRLLAPGRASGDNIRGWLAAHAGAEADAVMRLNPRYVFFTLAPDDGRQPPGAAGVPLPPGRGLAVDPSRHGYGELYWIDASAPILTGATRRYRRLGMALDTGAAIRGEVRADLYIGRGDAAGDEAGRVRHTLRMVRLVPVPAGG